MAETTILSTFLHIALIAVLSGIETHSDGLSGESVGSFNAIQRQDETGSVVVVNGNVEVVSGVVDVDSGVVEVVSGVVDVDSGVVEVVYAVFEVDVVVVVFGVVE